MVTIVPISTYELLAVCLGGIAIISSGISIYLNHLKGPDIDLYLNYDDDKSKVFSVKIIQNQENEQHFDIRKVIDVAFVNKGSHSGGLSVIDYDEEGKGIKLYFHPPTDLLYTNISYSDYNMTLSPGEVVPISFSIFPIQPVGHLREVQVSELMKTPKKTLKIVYKATTRKGFEKKEKTVKLMFERVDIKKSN